MNIFKSVLDRYICSRLKNVERFRMQRDGTWLGRDGHGQVWYLYLSSNKLTSLNSSLFENLTNLQYLYLSSNKLTSLDPAVFANIRNTNLTKIYIDGNPVASPTQSVTYFCNGNSLCEFYCSYNSTANTFVLCSGRILT